MFACFSLLEPLHALGHASDEGNASNGMKFLMYALGTTR
jgi:hypothetical protein